jgi:hypothetical protein
MCAYKSLILDIDGVIVRDKLLMNHVNENCVKYVRSKMPECKDPRAVNRILYMTTGHTARGLHTNFGVDVSDFNEKVYDKKLIEHLAEVLSTFEFQEEAKYIHEWTKHGWKVTLLTNAPTIWAGTVARAISDEIYIRPGPDNVMSGPLKPDATAYADFSKTYTNIFVDDSLKNLATTRWMPNWHPVHFSQELAEPMAWCPTVGSLWELGLFLNSVDKSS